MKSRFFIAALLIASFSCCIEQGPSEYSSNQTNISGSNSMIANPAAVYCKEKGYDYRIVTEENGSRGECYVEGEWADEWAVYRNKEESRRIAEDFIKSSATYVFDGSDLKFADLTYSPGRGFVAMTYEFVSRHAGYGDREGMVLAQVITPHTAVVVVEGGHVTSAVLDGSWNMMTQKEISEKPIGGDRDEHGCLGPAGYSWCASTESCMRKWEEDCQGDTAIASFEDCIVAGYPVMESYPRQCMVSGTNKSFTEVLDVALED